MPPLPRCLRAASIPHMHCVPFVALGALGKPDKATTLRLPKAIDVSDTPRCVEDQHRPEVVRKGVVVIQDRVAALHRTGLAGLDPAVLSDRNHPAKERPQRRGDGLGIGLAAQQGAHLVDVHAVLRRQIGKYDPVSIFLDAELPHKLLQAAHQGGVIALEVVEEEADSPARHRDRLARQ